MADISEDVIIVTSSLTKDMTGKDDLFRGPAIRALCKITDASMLHAIERYMKQVQSEIICLSMFICNKVNDPSVLE